MDFDLDLEHAAPKPIRKDFRIGIIGAGFVIREVQIPAYRHAGYNVTAIASRTPETAHEVADLHSVPHVYDTFQGLLADRKIEIIDLAVPPDQQLAIIREVVKHADHVKGVLAHKPLALNYTEAAEIVRLCEEAGITLAVNQNMRHDPSIRAVRSLLQRGELGEPIVATIEMRAIPHWQSWLREYQRLTLLNMSVHHLDCFRFLFGDPEVLYASARTDPRTRFPHKDGICFYILEYENGLRASAWDDIWAGTCQSGAAPDPFVKWRVEGTKGIAQGSVGWPDFPNRKPSTIQFTTMQSGGCWLTPQWNHVWFPDAFAGTMGQLMDAVARNTEPDISGRDNLKTMALVDACYLSLQEHRPVRVDEITKNPSRTSPEIRGERIATP
ncbi:MAG TPA: Gfo/Idh/MocA family oxidoreductase [Bryobacteraceae bacterium]|nr:Gfo/Idh/MocA family oxidoreductase [Bryobacteraceae bacterium]